MVTTTLLPAHEKVINSIREHIRQNGDKFDEWFIGIAKNAAKKLFVEHRVNEYNDKWIYRTAIDFAMAKEIKQYFVTLGVEGDDINDDITGNIIYAYKKQIY